MKSLILALVGMVTLGLSAAAFAENPAGLSDAKAETKATLAPADIKGEVLKVDGDSFVVNDERSNSEVKFTIEGDVKAGLERPLKQGDRIEASLTPEGYAKRIVFEEANEQGGKSPEGANPTLSPDGKGSASGG